MKRSKEIMEEDVQRMKIYKYYITHVKAGHSVS